MRALDYGKTVDDDVNSTPASHPQDSILEGQVAARKYVVPWQSVRLLEEVALLDASHRHKDLGALTLSQLDGGLADTASCRMDQHRRLLSAACTLCQVTNLVETAPCRYIDRWDNCSLGKRYALRHFRKSTLPTSSVGSEGAVVGEAEYPIAGFEADHS